MVKWYLSYTIQEEKILFIINIYEFGAIFLLFCNHQDIESN